MSVKIGSWMLYRGDEKDETGALATVSISAKDIKVVPVSQYIELRDKDGVCFATITWPSTTKIRKIGV